MNSFGYNVDYSRGKRLEESRKDDGRKTYITYTKGKGAQLVCHPGIYEYGLETMALA